MKNTIVCFMVLGMFAISLTNGTAEHPEAIPAGEGVAAAAAALPEMDEVPAHLTFSLMSGAQVRIGLDEIYEDYIVEPEEVQYFEPGTVATGAFANQLRQRLAEHFGTIPQLVKIMGNGYWEHTVAIQEHITGDALVPNVNLCHDLCYEDLRTGASQIRIRANPVAFGYTFLELLLRKKVNELPDTTAQNIFHMARHDALSIRCRIQGGLHSIRTIPEKYTVRCDLYGAEAEMERSEDMSEEQFYSLLEILQVFDNPGHPDAISKGYGIQVDQAEYERVLAQLEEGLAKVGLCIRKW